MMTWAPAGSCYHCHTGRCPVGVATQDVELRKRLHGDEAAERVYTAEVPRRFLDEHLAILDALKQGDPKLVEQRMRSHIEHGRTVLAKALAK